MHEASLHEESCFITLTYGDENLPKDGTLVKEHFQKFMKRLRKSLEGKGPDGTDKRVRYYHVGEYGERNFRPHYHALIFGHMFSELAVLGTASNMPEVRLYRSSELERLWTLGVSSVGSVTLESASYLARYVMGNVDMAVHRRKKWSVDPETGEMHEVLREYSTMSRDSGLGRGWYDKFGEEVERLETVRIGESEALPPRFYDELLRERDEAAWLLMKLRRERKSEESRKEWSEEKRDRIAREVIARERLVQATRRLDNERDAAVPHLRR